VVFLQAVPDVTITAKSAIRQIDVQALVLWVLGDGQSPRWVFVKVIYVALCLTHPIEGEC
jgi:hypothetical protein